MYFPLLVGFLCLSLFCNALRCVRSGFCNHSEEEEKAGCFAIIVLQMYFYYKYSVALPHGVVGRLNVKEALLLCANEDSVSSSDVNNLTINGTAG